MKAGDGGLLLQGGSRRRLPSGRRTAGLATSRVEALSRNLPAVLRAVDLTGRRIPIDLRQVCSVLKRLTDYDRPAGERAKP